MRNKILYKYGGLFGVVIVLYMLFVYYSVNNSFIVSVNANETDISTSTSCNDNMTPEECLQYLQDQYSKVKEQKEEVEKALEAEAFTQSSIYGQLNYLNNQIKQTQLQIQEKELLIEQKSVEISILSRDIKDIRDNIATVKQELKELEESVYSKVSAMYKTIYYDSSGLLLGDQDIVCGLISAKYLAYLRDRDEELLSELSDRKLSLEDYDRILSQKVSEVAEKQNEIENERAELAKYQANLDRQKQQQEILLAESQKREQEYQELLAQLQGYENQLSEQVSALIMELYKSGQLGEGTHVNRGDIVGYQGHTGCALGSHLHFEIRKDGKQVNPCSGYLTCGGLYAPVTAGSVGAPLDGGYLTQTYHSGHAAIDMVSFTAGDQSGATYHVEKGEVACPAWLPIDDYLPADFSLRGEGAPVRAIADGVVYVSTADSYGGHYVLIDHGDGLMSLYLHLR